MDLHEEIEHIKHQEDTYVFTRFDNARAIELGSAIHAMAVERGLAVAIDVRRPDQVIYHAAMNGTSPDNEEWVRRKSNAVFRFHRSSLRFTLELEAAGKSMEERYAVSSADFANSGGSFPVRVEGVGVGAAVTVSGLPHRDDHALAVEGLARQLAVDRVR